MKAPNDKRASSLWLKQGLIHVLLPLGVGFLFYQLFRKNTILHQLPFPYQGVFADTDFFASTFLRNYFCDFIWCYALTSSLSLIFPQKKASFLCPIIAFSVGLLYEISQQWGLFPGTGDCADVFTYLLAATAAHYRILFYQRRHHP